MSENWLITDESNDVAGSIRHALRTASFVGEDPQAWKWIALALHSALQGACVCHLSTTAMRAGIEIGSIEIHSDKIIIQPKNTTDLRGLSEYDIWKISRGENTSRVEHVDQESDAPQRNPKT